MVAQGHRQEEGIDYDEVFAPVARIEAIRLFLAFASFMGFTVYQMEVKSAFYMALLKRRFMLTNLQVLWIQNFQLEFTRFKRGTIDKTLFIKKMKNDILLVQVYVDDIIFGSTKESLSTKFEQLMHKRFQMSSMGELTFFLASTPMETHKPLLQDTAGTYVNVHLYRSMIGSLMYLTSSRLDIMFAVCACSRFQVQPKASHMHAVKRIFRYLKGQPTLGLWYPKDSPMDLIAYSDSDYAGASIDRKSITGGCQFLGCRLISWQCKKQTIVANSTTEAKYIIASNCRRHVGDEAVHKELGDRMERAATTASSFEAEQDSGSGPRKRESEIGDGKALWRNFKLVLVSSKNPTIYASFIKQFWTTATSSTNVNGEVELTASIDGQAKTITEASLRRHLKLEDNGGITSLPNTEIFEQLALMGYATDSDKLTFQKVTRGYSSDDIPLFSSMITAPDTSPSRITSSPSLSPQHTPVSAPSTSPPPITETSPTTEEPALIPHESPLQSVHSLGRDEGSVSLNELMDLVTQLTNKVGGLENELKNTKKVYGTAITKLAKRVKKLEMQVKTGKASRRTKIVLSEDEAVEEDSSKQGRSLIEELDMDADISLVPPHAEIQEKISDETEVLLEEEEATEIVQDQGSGEKGEQEVSTADTALNTANVPISTASETPQVSTAAGSLKLGHEEAIRLQEQINEEERKRIARDAEIAKQLQEEYDKAGKKEAVTEVDTAHVIDWNDPSVIRYHALQNTPRSVVEVRKNMMVYLKNQGGYKMKDFKGMSYDDIRPIFKKEQLNQMIIIVQDEGMNVEALQTKYPIIGWEVYSEDTMQFWKIIIVGNHTEIYQVFKDMLKNFDREDLDKLWSLVQERYNSSGLAEDKEIEL
ncbi:putative ribonuclease H-like domain-containing protein [Tanacetum coccineum]